MKVSKLLDGRRSFIVRFARSSGKVLDFQADFWNFIEQLKSYDIPWFCEEGADDHFLCWSVLGQAWKYDLDSVSICLRYTERLRKEWNEDEERLEVFYEDVYGFAYVREDFIDELGLPVYEASSITDLGQLKEKELDLGGLLSRFAS